MEKLINCCPVAKEKNVCKYCMEVVTDIFKKIFYFFKNLCFNKESDKKAGLTDSIFHKERITMFGSELQNTDLPLEKRAQAAYKLGLLAFTGGPMSAKWVSEYMNEAALILKKSDTPPHIKITLMQGIASWCYLNTLGQKKAKAINLLPLLVSFLEEESENPQLKQANIKVKFWSCYLIIVIICNQPAAIRELKEYDVLKSLLQVLAAKNWHGWPENFAEVLFFLLGFQRT
ncbi:armadillo-like helical domain-containing protein 2 [Macrotis lagotis]|uniref:armadillo-like helical domain-containing protein 2 n=1 Tax=Macrotis lagotis TaxID=92651 RepID=UPI003D69C969